ncbi:MAG: PQQ-binding-like beta-propeller repeat protein [Candidatus Marinimicrobia bacterium]|nr:PQQ-binding-like beta-propeller repeat protein [Candidatus Neomarinimicrobiota bacterium]
MRSFIRILTLLGILATLLQAGSPLTLINPTYLGNEQRNYYGNAAPSRLDIIWKTDIGEGRTKVGQAERVWKGSGWTGQPLMLEENGRLFLVHGSLDHRVRKIDALGGEVIWTCEFPDAIKGTGTLWQFGDRSRTMLIQGSRRGLNASTWSTELYPLRALDIADGSEIWRYHVMRGESFSTDVDGTPLIYRDTVYLGLENGYFVVFDPDPERTVPYKQYFRPKTLEKHPLFNDGDKILHGQNLVTESSPARLGNRLYITAGSGHVYGYDLTTRKIEWDFFVGADMDGSPVVTFDSCILVPVEKEYISGQGGVFKLDPSKPADSSCVVWYFPTGDDATAGSAWKGGVVASPAVNDLTRPENLPHIAGFSAIDGYLYLVEHDSTDTARVWGPNREHRYPKPRLIASRWVGKGISTPLLIGNRIVSASYSGVSLFEFSPEGKVLRLQRRYIGGVESTPFVHNKRIYVGSRDGYLYCLGEAEE